MAETLAAVDSLMGQVDEENLRTVVDELNVAFADPDDLGRVITSGSELLETFDSAWPETLRTLQNGRTVLRTSVDTADDFQRFADLGAQPHGVAEGLRPEAADPRSTTPRPS